jgi:hypothetical protein
MEEEEEYFAPGSAVGLLAGISRHQQSSLQLFAKGSNQTTFHESFFSVSFRFFASLKATRDCGITDDMPLPNVKDLLLDGALHRI